MNESWPECKEFYDMMQRYRHMPITWQKEVVDAYEEVKEWLRQTRRMYMKVINCRTLGEMCEYMLDGEPVFIIRAQDKFSVEALEQYKFLITDGGGKNTFRTTEDIQRFINWQKANPQRVKVPD